MTTKLAKCHECCPDGGAILTASWDYSGEDRLPVWRCNNCGTETPRRIAAKRTENSPLTPSQLQAITQIQQYKLRDDNKYEVKKFTVCQLGWNVSVGIAVGMKNDEGTMAAVYCRSYGHFLVGPSGGIKSFGHLDEDKQKAKKHPLIYGWHS